MQERRPPKPKMLSTSAVRVPSLWILVGAFLLLTITDAAETSGCASSSDSRIELSLVNLASPATNGTVVVQLRPDWAPLGVQRICELIEQGFFSDIRIFRVVPRFIVQFGIHGDPAVARRWQNARLSDDPVKKSNVRGTLTFATAGRNTRTTQLFINLVDNAFLDSQGFSPIGIVLSGMEWVDKIFNVGEHPDQGTIQAQGNSYLDRSFPKMSAIRGARVVVPLLSPPPATEARAKGAGIKTITSTEKKDSQALTVQGKDATAGQSLSSGGACAETSLFDPSSRTGFALWASIMAAVGYRCHRVRWTPRRLSSGTKAFIIGALVMGLWVAIHRGGRSGC